jgi:NAD-dependent SIR2 family protein deacetylase
MCAGLSADSGLPIYDQIANEPAWTERRLTYGDLCRPSLLETDPDMAYGFWSERERRERERQDIPSASFSHTQWSEMADFSF